MPDEAPCEATLPTAQEHASVITMTGMLRRI
jgi:hypothetical protein